MHFIIRNPSGAVSTTQPVADTDLLIEADNPAHAKSLGVNLRQWFVASAFNTMGLPRGTAIQQLFY